MIVWGGQDESAFLGTGASYDPVMDEWEEDFVIARAPERRPPPEPELEQDEPPPDDDAQPDDEPQPDDETIDISLDDLGGNTVAIDNLFIDSKCVKPPPDGDGPVLSPR